MTSGYFAIGVYHPKIEANIGTLYRTAYLYNAAFVFTVGRRYKRLAADTPNTPAHIPLFHFETMEDLVKGLPLNCPLVGVELDEKAVALPKFSHPKRACYLLGAEDRGLSQDVMDECESLVQIPTLKPYSMNLAAAGSILMYDRSVKQ